MCVKRSCIGQDQGIRVAYLAPPVNPSALSVMQTEVTTGTAEEDRRPTATDDSQRHE
jgi:hypothetical protein